MILARVAGLPSAGARVGELPETVRLLSELDALRADARRHGDELADLIHPAIGGCEDRAVRRALLACRRAVHNGRAPLPLPEAALRRLTGQGRELLTRLGEEHLALEEGRRTVRETFNTERAEAEHRLADLVADQDFLRALAMASDALFPDVQSWLNGPPDHPEHLHTRRRVVSYVLRTALKTSPFSTLTTAGPVVEGGDPRATAGSVQMSAPDRLARRVELNAEVEFQLEQLLTQGSGPLLLRTNPTLTVSGERVLIVRSDGGCVAVPPLPWVLGLAELAADGAPIADLAAYLTTEHGAANEEAATMLGRLTSAGFLQGDLGVADQEPDRLSLVAERLGLAPTSPLRRVVEAVGEVEAADDPADRWISLGRLRSAVGAALSDSGGDESLIPGKYLCYEDAVPGWTDPQPVPDWTALDSDLHRVRRLVSVFDGALPGRLAITELLERRFGTGSGVGLIEAWAAWNDASAHGAARDGSGAVGPDLRALRDNPFHLADTGVPRIEELRRVQGALLEHLTPPDDCGPAFAADTGALDRLLGELPAWLPTDHPATLYLQPLEDGTVAFNAASPGYGTPGSRVLRGAPGTRPAPDTGEGEPLLVEVAGLFRSSLNRVDPLASHELTWPGCVPTLPPDRRVRPADLEIRPDPGGGLPVLWWRPADRPVRLIHRGTMGRYWFPPLLRFLLDLTTPMAEAWALVGRARTLYVNPKPHEVSVLPRLHVGGVLMERRSWVVPRAEIGLGEADDLDAFASVRARARELGLPDVVFARAADIVDTNERVMEKAKDRRPRPLDLCSWWGVEELSRMARGRDLVLFQEAAPAVFGPDRVVEYAVEVPGGRQ